MSTLSTQSITTESEYWESYKLKRKQDIQAIQGTITESLSLLTNIEQTIVVKREELHRLDFTELEEVLKDIDRVGRGKKDLSSAVKSEMDTKFYGVLKSVSSSSVSTSVNHQTRWSDLCSQIVYIIYKLYYLI